MAIETPARIAVLGAGPIGLEAALYARYLGYDVDLYERGSVAASVLAWGHVRMFTPFGMNRSPLGLAALKAQNPAWQPPADDAHLAGHEFAKRYLLPLASSDLLVDGLHEHTRVDGVGRANVLKGELAGDDSRADGDFQLLLASTRPEDHGRQRYAAADVVVDTTGTYGNHNWLGPGGPPAIGERSAAAHIEYALPDIAGRDRERYASRNILLVGSGDSAATTLVALAELAAHAPDTWITWVTRHECEAKSSGPLAEIADDSLPERARLARAANRLAVDDANHVTLAGGTVVEAVDWHADRDRFSVRLAGKQSGEHEFDRIIANVGYRPDASVFAELQVGQCGATGAPVAMARAIENCARIASARSTSFGPESLINPEPDFYVLGAKSFGRDSRFLIAHGLAQIRALFAIIGDRPELDLYATMAGLY